MATQQFKISQLPPAAPFVGDEWIEVVQNGISRKSTIAQLLKPGPDGKSAYQLAQQEGFEGSQFEWLLSLKGKDGTNGKSAHQARAAGRDA